MALPSTRRAGRGRTARLVVADEHSQHAWAEASFAALQPTMEAGGQFLFLSTADGMGNLFAQFVDVGEEAGQSLDFVFLPYSLPATGSGRGVVLPVVTVAEPWSMVTL